MRRRLLLGAAVSFGLALLLFAYQEAQAQPRSGPDTIRFMAAVRGNTFDPTLGLEWCVSQGWHESYLAGPSSDPYPAGPRDALDEVSQWGSPGWTYANCHSNLGDLVDLATNGSTNGGSICTISAPCPSLIVKGRGTVYAIDGCNAIEADVYDYSTYDAGTKTGDWKGKQRILHASASPSTWTSVIYVAYLAWYFDFVTVGTIINETSTGCPITGPHAHQDFMPPTQSQNCQAAWNDATIPASPGTSMDLQRQNPDHYVHSLVHSYGVACVVLGPDAANWLLRSGGGELDDTGQGMRDLASGAKSSITSAPTCITGTSWCGTYTVTPQLAVAAYRRYQGMSPIDYFNSQQKSIPPSGSALHYFWYGPDSQGYYLQVWWIGTYIDPISGYRTDCSPGPAGGPRYWAGWTSNSFINRCGGQDSVSIGGAAGSPAGIDYYWGQFRGAGGVNPSIPPSQLQQDANTWVQTQINSGHWGDVVKPALNNVIRAGRNPRDMATLGITGNPPFDGNPGQVGMAGAGVMNKMNTLAFRITGPASFDFGPTRGIP